MTAVKKTILLLFAAFYQVFAAPIIVHAEALFISPDDAVQKAIDYNLNLKKLLLDVSSADYQARRLWAEFFPSISATASAGYSGSLFSGSGFEFNDKGTSYSASLGISLGLNASSVYAIKNIRLAYQSKLLSYEDACNQLEIQVIKNFYSLIAERENLGVLNETLNLARQQLEKSQLGFNNGLVSELILTQSKLALENARYELGAARLIFETHMEEFLALLGLSQGTETVLSGKIEISGFDVDAEALIRQYLPGRPDIVIRRQEIERLENAERQAALNSRSPSIDLSLGWRSANFAPFSDSLSGTAKITIPIDSWIPGTRGAQSVRNAGIAIDKARLDLKIAENQAAIQIRSLAANVRNSWDSVEIARLGLQAAELSYELTEQGFRNGAIEYLKLEDARNNLTNIRQRLLRSELVGQTAVLDLCAALNINWKELIK